MAQVKKLKATVDKNRRGFAFLVFDQRGWEDLFLPRREASEFFHGDRVEVHLNKKGEVLDFRIESHRFREIVGQYKPAYRSDGGWVSYQSRKTREDVFVPKNKRGKKKIQEGDWVRVKLHFQKKGPDSVIGEIIDVFGKKIPANEDLRNVAAEFSLEENFSKKAEAEAKKMTLNLTSVMKHRKDFRKIPFVTIDGEDARDFDDAIFVEKNKSGFVLWVGIADVSFYVKKGNALDKEAYQRGTSVYFPERAFHMLPKALSENLCSLKPNEPRLSMVVKIHFNPKVETKKIELFEAIIQSKRRATYRQIEDEWLLNQGDPSWEFTPHFELYEKLRKKREIRGSIDFELPEAKVKTDQNGEPAEILVEPRYHSHRLIEEFMIAANEGVTAWMNKKKRPFLYRVHEEPDGVGLEKFSRLAASFGYKLPKKKITPLAISKLIRRFKDHPAELLLNLSLLRSLKQAIYTAEPGRHFGLASEAYTHFTSPIRRYPDLEVHRQLKKAMMKNRQKTKSDADLEKIAEHCSLRERIAVSAEREAIRIKQVRLMQNHLGDEFEGKINGMNKKGLFIQITHPFVEGFVSARSLTDDFYIFNEKNMTFSGRRKKQAYHVGDSLTIQVVRANLERREIEFEIKGKRSARQVSPR